MHSFWSEYVVLMTIFLGGLIGPGPDFVMIIRNSAANTRKSGVITAIGLALGILTHAMYSILGLGVILASSELAINIIKYCGVGYLTYIAIGALRSKKQPVKDIDIKGEGPATMTNWQAFRMGYITEILNPHAATFILTLLLSVQVSPMLWKMSYGVSMSVSSVIWYSIVAIFLTNSLLRKRFLSVRHIIDRLAGVVLLLLAARLAFSKIAVVSG